MSKLTNKDEDEGTSETMWSKTFTSTKDVAYFLSNLNDRITPEIRDFLESYGRIPQDEVVGHIYSIREKAWTIRAYPCTGFALFLQPMLPLSPAYLSILERLRNEQASLIDVGCFIGHDLRRLVFDGCPPDRLVGCDIVNHWDLGFEFYRDQDRPFGKHVTYLEDDVLHPKTILFGNENDAHLREKNLKLLNFRGQMDIINASHILHHWDWNDQVRVCKTLVALSKGPQSIIVGCQIGSTGKTKMEPHCKENPYATSETYWHNPDTWKQMWDVIEQETGTKWVTEAKLKTFEEMGWRTSDWWYIGDCARLLQFVVQRIE